jgi:hypothetical protein
VEEHGVGVANVDLFLVLQHHRAFLVEGLDETGSDGLGEGLVLLLGLVHALLVDALELGGG